MQDLFLDADEPAVCRELLHRRFIAVGLLQNRQEVANVLRGRLRPRENTPREQRGVVDVNCLSHLEANWQDGVQARHGLLEHHRDSPSAYRSHGFADATEDPLVFSRSEAVAGAFSILAREVHEVFVVEDHLATGDRCVPRKEGDDGEPQRGFPTAAFTRDPQNLSASEREVDAIQGLVDSPSGVELDVKIANGECIRHASSVSADR